MLSGKPIRPIESSSRNDCRFEEDDWQTLRLQCSSIELGGNSTQDTHSLSAQTSSQTSSVFSASSLRRFEERKRTRTKHRMKLEDSFVHPECYRIVSFAKLGFVTMRMSFGTTESSSKSFEKGVCREI
jgi:hypothetical protein